MAPPVPNVPLSVQLEVMPGSTLPSLLSGRRLRNQRLARALRLWVPAGVLIFILALCFLWPLVYKLPSPTVGNILYNNEPPFSPGHILGTNVQGVDEFSDVIYGGQTSFVIAASVTVIGIVIGCTLGVVAGYLGGWVDAIISRILDILIAFPALVLALVIAVGLGPSEIHLIWALSFFGIPALGRVTRGITLTLRSQPYMTAARLAGTPRWRIIVRHILPNIMPTIVTFSLLGVGIIIILEGALDFLGYGIQQPQPSWGGMIALGQQIMTAQPEYIIIPSIALLITVVALNMLGDALRERWGVV